MTSIEFREITDRNRDAVVAIHAGPAEGRFVSSVVESIEEAAESPEGNPWYRAVYLEGEPVGFVMLSWNVTPDAPDVIGPWFLWKLLVDERHRAPMRDDAIGGAEVMYRSDIVARGFATPAQLSLGQRAVGFLRERFDVTPLYARVNVIAGEDGVPLVLELEAVEPNLFLAFADGAADRLAHAITAVPAPR